jgi:exo-1,4-beta-D-glucosaminidase
MKTLTVLSTAFIVLVSHAICTGQAPVNGKMLLKDNWAIRSAADVKEKGELISTTSFKAEKWYPATVPSTVLANLVENKVFPDPYFGTNIESLPGYTTDRKTGMPENSPFRSAWWYRTVMKLPEGINGRLTWLNFHSINYRANIWLNGHLVADTTEIEGAYRLYNLNISEFVIAGKENCLALEIFPPKGMDLTITWVDWNPTPPDRGMGIWYDVSVRSTGPVALENTRVITKLNLPSTDKAKISVTSELFNGSLSEVRGILRGKIENIEFSQEVILEPNEKRVVAFDPQKFSQLEFSNPRLWWPHTMGKPNLYDLDLVFEIEGKVSDSGKTRFGIREITSWMNNFDNKHTRVFQINGKNMVIRGGGYVEDMMLRPSDKRVDIDIRYAKYMGLNALRMEAPRGSDYLFEKCDEEGILLMVGWCCCSSWERWKNWTPHIADIAEKSWRDQIVHLRNHPAIFDWLYGSDNFPPTDVEKRYIQVLNEFDGTRPYQSSATKDSSAIAGNTGLWMGPYPMVYAWMPPSYWYSKLEFNTEAGPAGEQIAPLESMRKMMPEADLWPMSKSWDLRLHKAFYPPARKALESRYGKPGSLEEYSLKSQVLQLEATRAMFEAFAGNKYRSSGIIYWMYNSAWPSLYWQLYDYYFAPNGAFYGTKRACEILHIQYAYDDGSVQVVNGPGLAYSDLKATVDIYTMDMKKVFSKEFPVSIGEDESKKIVVPEKPAGIQGVYFLKLVLNDASGKPVSSGFYWLSTKGDDKADFTALNNLPRVKLNCHISGGKQADGRFKLKIDLENTSRALAFSVNPKILKSTSKDLVLPVFWEDNYISLLPGEKRTLVVEFNAEDLGGEKPLFMVDGWNIDPQQMNIP